LKFLLDTHALLWWLFDDPRLKPPMRHLISDPFNTILVSSASAWEIATKHRLGKLEAAGPLVEDMEGWIARARFVELPIGIEHARRAGGWPHPHRDPFDRMIAAQSAVESLPLITADPVLRTFGIETVWSRGSVQK
jgi:PIN domain nuclease of toxin-antitoxin system